MKLEKNKLILAAAGSGKTTFLIDHALQEHPGNTLITSYTISNCDEIKYRIINKLGSIPNNLDILPWFTFLLRHGVKPFQGTLFNEKIKGVFLVKSQSTQFVKQSDTRNYYFNGGYQIYTDKIAKFVIECDQLSAGAVVDRISRVYDRILIDEFQDLAGYDLNLLTLLFKSEIEVVIVGDPRQGTYSTNSAQKNKNFRRINIVEYFAPEKGKNLVFDDTTLNTNYRCTNEICEFSDKFNPQLSKSQSGNLRTTGHDGLFTVPKELITQYLNEFSAMQLRYDVKVKVNENFPVINFGNSKGLQFERVLIYPTKKFFSWLKVGLPLEPITNAKFYVAFTRASQSVAVVTNEDLSGYGFARYGE